MVLLNDDCLLEIFSHLELADQMRVTRTHPHFKNLMRIIWRKSTNIDLTLFGSEFGMDELKIVIDCLCNSVQQIKDNRMTWEKFNILMTYVFPEMRDFRFYQTHPRDLQDDAIIEIIKAFPNLRVFRPCGLFTGNYFSEIAHLENLTLTDCGNSFTYENFLKIIARRQLKSLRLNIFRDIDLETYTLPTQHLTKLELLEVNDEELTWIVTHFAELKNLNEFIVNTTDIFDLEIVSDCLVENRRNHVSLLQMCSLERCMLCIDQISCERMLIASALKLWMEIKTHTYLFYELRELYFKLCNIGKKVNCASLIYNAPNAELVCVEECNFLFTKFKINVARITRNRTKKLKLALFNNKTRFSDRDVPINWLLHGKSKLFELTTEEGSGNIFTTDPIRIIFN